MQIHPVNGFLFVKSYLLQLCLYFPNENSFMFNGEMLNGEMFNREMLNC